MRDNMILIIRPMVSADIRPLADLTVLAFAGNPNPERYSRSATMDRLEWSLESWDCGGPVTLIAELGGVPVAMGQYGPARWASFTWEMMLGSTHPDHQGRGIGHALVMARLDAIARSGGGMVFVSTRSVARWCRYGFTEGPTNPMSGATTLWRMA